MSEGEIAEELPNGDDSAFEEQHSDRSETTQGTVYVDAAEGVITAEHYQDESGKTTHIVIHDQALDSGLKTPTTPLPPPTPATPLSRERGLRYQWDDSAHSDVLPVRCKNQNGELHKIKFGSGVERFFIIVSQPCPTHSSPLPCPTIPVPVPYKHVHSCLCGI